MRIISGKYKGRVYNPPPNFRARPTTDFAKENLFNILNNRIDWEETTALDLFGGTGGISYELVSRGCPKVVCVENDAKHAEFIAKMKDTLLAHELTVHRMDVFKYLEYNKQQYDLVFVDPPYDYKEFESIAKIILEKNILTIGGLLVLEHSNKFDFSELAQFSEMRKYGSVHFSLFASNKKS